MGNLPPLLDNVCYGLRAEAGRKAFLWSQEYLDRARFKYKAERYAHEVELLLGATPPMLALGFAQHGVAVDDERQTDLLRFILVRHANHFWGRQIKRMWWGDV